MMNIVWHAMGINEPPAGRLITWGLNPSDKVKLFKSLGGSKRFPMTTWITETAQCAELEAIAAEANRIRELRNKVAHGLWSFAPKEKGKYRILWMRENEQKMLPDSIKMPLADIKKLASDLDALNKRLNAFRKMRGARVP